MKRLSEKRRGYKRREGTMRVLVPGFNLSNSLISWIMVASVGVAKGSKLSAFLGSMGTHTAVKREES